MQSMPWTGVSYSRLENDHNNPNAESITNRLRNIYNKYSRTLFLKSSPRLLWILIGILSFLSLFLMTSVYHLSNINSSNISSSNTDLPAEVVPTAVEVTDERPLILYAYHETDNARENAQFFIDHGLHDGADFIFILNGKAGLEEHIPKADHIKVIERENHCYDLGAYAETLLANDGELLSSYKKFIMMNASIRGPFLPMWSSDCWSDAYLNRVTDTNKLVGMSFNCKPVIGTRHIQSMILATDRTGLDVLLDGVISGCYGNWTEAVNAEANTTAAIIHAGYTVSAMMTAFSSDAHYVDNCNHGDILFNDVYYGTNIHPYEMMFQKANRNIYPEQLKLLTEWHNKANYSSQPFCGKEARKARYRPAAPPTAVPSTLPKRWR